MSDWTAIDNDELDTLVEALEAWENKDFAGEMMGDLFGAMILKDDPVAKAKEDERRKADQLTRERKKAMRKERSVILRAKLLMLRNSRRVGDVEAGLLRSLTR